MNDVTRYIFNSLGTIQRAIISQERFNRRVLVFAVAITAYSAFQAKRIERLENEIREMGCQKGE